MKKQFHKFFSPKNKFQFIWDIDKTYLDTKFDRFWQMLKIPFEKSNDKKNIPGSGALLRQIQTKHKDGLRPTPMYFLSASPEWMKKVLLKKLRQDGIRRPQLLLKQSLHIGKRIFSKSFNDIPAYKLKRLFESNQKFSQKNGMVLVGDNWENDLIIYLLYQDILNRKITFPEIAYHLSSLGATEEQINELWTSVKTNILPHMKKIYIIIHWLRPRTVIPNYFNNEDFFISRNHFQAAIFLYIKGLLPIKSLCPISEEISLVKTHYRRLLFYSITDLIYRGYLSRGKALWIMVRLFRKHLLEPKIFSIWRRTMKIYRRNQDVQYGSIIKKMNNLDEQSLWLQKLLVASNGLKNNNKWNYCAWRGILKK